MINVSIPFEEYLKLIEDARMLAELRAAGVDNWEGYSEAIRSFHEQTDGPEDDDKEDYTIKGDER